MTVTLKLRRGLSLLLIGALALAVQVSRAQSGSGQSPAAGAQSPSPSTQEANPFPDDTTKVPVMPSRDHEGTAPPPPPASVDNTAPSPYALPADGADPVRSPDEDAADGDMPRDNVTGSSSSSSQSGMDRLRPDTDSDEDAKGKHRKVAVQAPEHKETSAEDIQVGEYYLDAKNWKAALSRFESAMVLSPDEPEVYWGLGECSRHLGKLADARGYYQKVALYDPDSKHGKEAIKILKEPEIANAKAATAASSPN